MDHLIEGQKNPSTLIYLTIYIFFFGGGGSAGSRDAERVLISERANGAQRTGTAPHRQRCSGPSAAGAPAEGRKKTPPHGESWGRRN